MDGAVSLSCQQLHCMTAGKNVGGAGEKVKWAWWEGCFRKNFHTTVHQPEIERKKERKEE